ncbi:MAG: hypothetical protein AAFP18_00610 [Bacteroidota bacterium]
MRLTKAAKADPRQDLVPSVGRQHGADAAAGKRGAYPPPMRLRSDRQPAWGHRKLT